MGWTTALGPQSPEWPGRSFSLSKKTPEGGPERPQGRCTEPAPVALGVFMGISA